MESIFEVTANKPALFIDAKGKSRLTVEELTIKRQLATSDKGTERPFAFGVPYEKEGDTLLPVVHNFNLGYRTVAIRVIAVTDSGVEFASSTRGSSGNVLSSLTYGFEVPLDNIREF